MHSSGLFYGIVEQLQLPPLVYSSIGNPHPCVVGHYCVVQKVVELCTGLCSKGNPDSCYHYCGVQQSSARDCVVKVIPTAAITTG